MSRHHNRHRRLAPIGACAATVAAIAVLAGSSSALAYTCQTPGYASGDTMQGISQAEVWLTSGGWGAHSSCSTAPNSSTITYSPTSDGQALEEFGDMTGELNAKEDKVAYESMTGTKDGAGQVLDWYAGTEYAPNDEELEKAEHAAGAKNVAQITIPVAQTPVAVLLSLPTGCKIESSSKVDLPNKTIGQLWEGTNKPSGEDPGGIQEQGGYATGTWGALFTQLKYTKITSGTPTEGQFLDEGGSSGCKQLIKPQVSENQSGTAYVFRKYLAQINRKVWGGYASIYVLWPSSAVVESDPLSKGSGEQLNDSDAHLAGNAAANPGSVGYADTADAVGSGAFSNKATSSTYGTGGGTSSTHQILWAEVQNNGTETTGATYTDPLISGGSVANCETEKLIPSDEGYPEEYTGSWSDITGTDPNISTDARSTDYPLCALMFDLVWHHYSNPNLFGKTETAEHVADTVRDLFEYIVGAGQSNIEGHDYTRFPTPMADHVKLAVNPGIGY
jgi:hypothetical protein